jgi:pimeloyl-ACP methyl ester carboxylesterase
MKLPGSLTTVFLILAATSCGDDSNPKPGDEFNPLGGATSMMPWPSMIYAKQDATSATGFRVDIPEKAMPVNVDSISVDPAALNRWDGFSPTGPILAQFTSGVSAAGLPTFKDPEPSLAANAPIILINLDTGERAPYFAEVDQNVADVNARALIIRPMARLKEKSRYAVAIRTSVKSASGGALSISPAFAALRDGTTFDHRAMAKLAPRYADIFAKLESIGVPRTEIALAWDFVTASDVFLTSDLRRMRTDMLAAIGPNGSNLTFTTTAQPANGAYKHYIGTYKSPDFLTAAETDVSIMRRDAAGNPKMQGFRDANFAAIIPKCIETQPLPRPTIVFGHGIFGSAKEYLNDDFVLKLAEQHCFIIIAGDFIGLTSRQLQLVVLALNDLNRAPQMTEKLAQSIIDFMSLEHAVRGVMAQSPDFKFNGKSVIDPAGTYYVGGSLGGIMGNTLMAYDPNLIKGVLAVPGGVWSMLFERSTAWAPLQGAAIGAYESPSSYPLLVAFLGMAMEPYDPITTAAHVIKDPLPGTPVKKIVMWEAIGDCLVGNMTTEMVAREMGIDLLGPTVKTPWRMTAKTGALPNAFYILDEKRATLTNDTNVPPSGDNGTHSGVNKRPALLRMIENFLIDNKIEATCKVSSVAAPCDCSVGACE